MNTEDQEPKIIVDDDWKTQVQAEKEALKQMEESKTENADDSAEASPDSSTENDDAGAMPEMELPPASFEMLITTLSAQAMSALGFLPDPATGKANTNRSMAKHFIDTLGVIEEKTKGNLTDAESNLLNETLHQLRMAFVTPPQSS